jgi:hypothetical protein
MLFTSQNAPHITLGNEQCLKLLLGVVLQQRALDFVMKPDPPAKIYANSDSEPDFHKVRTINVGNFLPYTSCVPYSS